jgi:hypothetical protein
MYFLSAHFYVEPVGTSNIRNFIAKKGYLGHLSLGERQKSTQKASFQTN